MFRWIVTFCLLAFPAFAQDVKLDAKNCFRALPSLISGLNELWQQPNFAQYIQVCPIIRTPTSPIALTVLILRLDQMYADNFPMPDTFKIPNPELLNNHGKWIGSLPEEFPTDGPGELQVTFTDWQNDFPHKIELFQAGKSALAPHPAPPMTWKDNRFVWPY